MRGLNILLPALTDTIPDPDQMIRIKKSEYTV